jgi:hypothetical protein
MNRVQNLWRKFAFFDKDIVSEQINVNFDSVPTCSCAEGGMLVFGDANGNIFIADNDFQRNQQKFKAFRGEVKAISYLFDPVNHRRQFVVAVGDDSRPRIAADGTVVPSITSQYVVKIFNMADMSRPVNAFLASPGVDANALLTSFAVMNDGSQIAIGFSNRTVLLFSGAFLKEGAMLRQVQPEVILQPRPTLMPVTGLHFCEISPGGSATKKVSPDNNDGKILSGSEDFLSGNTSSGDKSRNQMSNYNDSGENQGDGMHPKDRDGGRSTSPPSKRRTRLFVVIDIDTSVAAAADANSMPYLEGSEDEFIRQQYPGTFGSASTMDRAPLSSADVMVMAEGGVLLLDTSVNVMGNVNGSTVISPLIDRRPMHILDERGAGKNCTSLMADTCELLVGRAEGVFSYSLDDRGGAAGFEGDKQCICTVGRYVLVGSTDLKTKKTSVTIYDLRNKFISMHSQLPQGESIAMVLNDGGAAYIITSSFTLLRFREKDTQAKLDVLLRKALYPLAISLAAEEQCEVAEIMKLYRTYGDYLYKKEEFELSVQQYCHTIGFLQPSYVVRRFLDPHRVGNLVHYLEKLQEKGLASNDHAVLLLTCYTKMERMDKILKFIYTCSNKPVLSQYTPSASHKPSTLEESSISKSWVPDKSLSNDQNKEFSSASGFVDFDAEASVDILKHAGMTDEALLLARRCGRNSRTMELLMDRVVDESGINEAMSHLTELVLSANKQELLLIIKTHGPRLLRLQPDVITTLFVRLVTGELDSLRQNANVPPLSGGVSIDDIIVVYVDNTAQLYIFLETVLKNRKTYQGVPLSPLAAETLLEFYLRDYEETKQKLNSLVASKSNKADLSAARKEEKASEKKILSFLDGHLTDTYDPPHALLLVNTYGCEAASRFLLDRMQSTELLMRKHIESGDEKGIFKVLRREGRRDPDLYVQVLSYFVRQAMEEPDEDEDEEERWDSVREVLRLVEVEDALSPMQIVSVVSQHPQLPLSVVAKYVGNALKSANDDIEVLEQNLASTTQTLETLQNGGGRGRIFSVGSSHSASNSPSPTKMSSKRIGKEKKSRKDSGISNIDDSDNDSHGDSMDPFSDDDEEGDGDVQSLGSASVSSRERQLIEQQEMSTEKEKWTKIKALASRRASDHESFFSELEGSEDGFSAVAAAFGKTEISIQM